MKRPLILSLAASALLLGACSEIRQIETVGSVMNPYCAPDQSVVWGVFPNSDGGYQPIKASPKNCPWYAGTDDSEVTVASK